MSMRTVLGGALALLLALPAVPTGATHGARQDDVAVLRFLVPEAASDRRPDRTPVKARYRWKIPRAVHDRPDAGGDLVHVVYLTTSDQPAPALDRLGMLEDSVRAQDAWMREASGLRWRLDVFSFRVRGRTRPVRAVDVTHVDAGVPSDDLTGLRDIRKILEARELDEPGKRYLVYAAVDAGPVCGEGEYPLSDDPAETGAYSAIYLYSDPGCGSFDLAADRRSPSWAETITQQELMHNDGAVPMTAPHDCRPTASAHVCTPALVATGLDPEMRDVMFPFASGPLTDKQLDLGRDDYFRHGLPYRDLADSPYLAPARRAL